MAGTYFVMSFVCSLRGNEGFMLDCEGLCYYIEKVTGLKEKNPHVIFPLLVLFKGEAGKKYHLLMAVPETNPGIKPRLWAERLVGLLKSENRIIGPALCKRDGSVISAR